MKERILKIKQELFIYHERENVTMNSQLIL